MSQASIPLENRRIAAGSSSGREMMALRSHHRGGPDTLVYERAPRPEPTSNQVLIAVHTAGITFAELGWDETWTRAGIDRTPIIPSHEVSGVVIQVGSDVHDLAVGAEVFALIPFDRDGAAAEYVALDSTSVAYRPLSVDHTLAGVTPLASLTALQALIDHGRLEPGQRILIHGGAGGVGLFAIQIARSLGAEVTTTARNEDRDLLIELGAAHVIDFVHQQFDAVPGSYDLVLDGIGGNTTTRSLRLIRRGGRIITLNGPAPADLARELGIEPRFFVVRGSRFGLDQITAMVDGGLLRIVLAAKFPLSQGMEAYESGLRPNRRPGKTALVVRG
jgi:NADPH:quinone reductase-like Zn-dependent oxidoreductase